MKKISIFNGTSRRLSRSGDRSESKVKTQRKVSEPDGSDTLRKLVNVKEEVKTIRMLPKNVYTYSI